MRSMGKAEKVSHELSFRQLRVWFMWEFFAVKLACVVRAKKFDAHTLFLQSWPPIHPFAIRCLPDWRFIGMGICHGCELAVRSIEAGLQGRIGKLDKFICRHFCQTDQLDACRVP